MMNLSLINNEHKSMSNPNITSPQESHDSPSVVGRVGDFLHTRRGKATLAAVAAAGAVGAYKANQASSPTVNPNAAVEQYLSEHPSLITAVRGSEPTVAQGVENGDNFAKSIEQTFIDGHSNVNEADLTELDAAFNPNKHITEGHAAVVLKFKDGHEAIFRGSSSAYFNSFPRSTGNKPPTGIDEASMDTAKGAAILNVNQHFPKSEVSPEDTN